jgi:hypothetical protein
MLGFLSFIVVMTLLFGTVGLIVTTIRNASETISGALRGDARHSENYVTFRPRAIRQMRPASPYYAPLRAAA